MPAYKNVTDQTLRYNLNGADPETEEALAPGEVLTLSNRDAYVVPLLFGPGQLEEVQFGRNASVEPHLLGLGSTEEVSSGHDTPVVIPTASPSAPLAGGEASSGTKGKAK